MNFLKLFLLVLPCTFMVKCSSAQSEPIKPISNLNASNAITIGNTFEFYSEVLDEVKEIYISLPPKYEQHVQSYPVIFTFEAEFLFEPTQIITKYMASRSKMPESIVVSIANGEFEKRYEANYERWKGKPELYIEFFTKELIPYIEKNYRVADHRTIIGLSPSSGFLFEVFSRKPELFDAYIALSAHLEWDRVEGEDLFEELISNNTNPDFPYCTFYLGRAETDFMTFTGSKEAFERAEQKLSTYKPNRVNIKLDVFEEDEHYLMVLNGIRSGMEAIYPYELWKNPGRAGWYKGINYAKEEYEDYYNALSEKYGFEIYPVENAHARGYSISGAVYSAKRWGTLSQVIQLAKLGTTYFPNSSYFHAELAEAYAKSGNKDIAEVAANKAIELSSKFDPENLNQLKDKLNTILE